MNSTYTMTFAEMEDICHQDVAGDRHQLPAVPPSEEEEYCALMLSDGKMSWEDVYHVTFLTVFPAVFFVLAIVLMHVYNE